LKGLVDEENSLRTREAAIRLPDVFDAVRVASLQMAEGMRAAQHDLAVQFQSIRMGLDRVGLHLGNMGTTMQATVVTIYSAAIQFAQSLAQKLGGKGPTAGFLGGLGGLLGGTLAGAKFGTVFGPLGTALGGIAGAFIGGLFDHSKNAVENSTSAFDALARTTERVNEALSNLPQGFKIARARYLSDHWSSDRRRRLDGIRRQRRFDRRQRRPQRERREREQLELLIRAIADAAKSNQNRGGTTFLIAGSRA
jgi:hypothetical protein